MSQCCGKIPTPEDIDHIRDSLDRSRDDQRRFYEREQERHEREEREAEYELESLRATVISDNTRQLERDLQNKIDEERGKVVFWQTKTEQLEGVGTWEKGTFQRSLPQQNRKDESGEHTYYDPRNYRSGVAFANFPRRRK